MNFDLTAAIPDYFCNKEIVSLKKEIDRKTPYYISFGSNEELELSWMYYAILYHAGVAIFYRS